MDRGREQRDAARLVRRGERHGHKIEQGGDAEEDLHVRHREQRRGAAERERGQRRARGGAAARREEERCRGVGRRR